MRSRGARASMKKTTTFLQTTVERRSASMPSRLLPALALTALAAATMASAVACAAGNEIDNTSGSGGGGTGSGGAGGGDGGASACKAGDEQACYSGPEGTAGIGICAAGKMTCAEDGSGF